MLKEAKRKERLALRKAKRASTIPAKEPETSYADKKGKYMKQKGVTLPKI
jgi:deoxycytidine triphosphate deaminase